MGAYFSLMHFLGENEIMEKMNIKHVKMTPGLLATDIHIQIQIILTMIISGDYFW